MSQRIDQFCDHLRRRLNAIEKRLSELQKKIEQDRETTRNSIARDVKAAEGSLYRIKDDANAARARMLAEVAKRKGESEEVIAEWMRNRETEKLERRAEDAEVFAAWSMMVAAAAIDEADLAALEAIAARLDLESIPPNANGRRDRSKKLRPGT